MSRLVIVVASDFSASPGVFNSAEEDFSAQKFLDVALRPAFLNACRQRSRLSVDLDGTNGYVAGFLEKAFGALSREFGSKAVLKTLELKSDDAPDLIQKVKQWVTMSGERYSPLADLLWGRGRSSV